MIYGSTGQLWICAFQMQGVGIPGTTFACVEPCGSPDSMAVFASSLFPDGETVCQTPSNSADLALWDLGCCSHKMQRLSVKILPTTGTTVLFECCYRDMLWYVCVCVYVGVSALTSDICSICDHQYQCNFKDSWKMHLIKQFYRDFKKLAPKEAYIFMNTFSFFHELLKVP